MRYVENPHLKDPIEEIQTQRAAQILGIQGERQKASISYYEACSQFGYRFGPDVLQFMLVFLCPEIERRSGMVLIKRCDKHFDFMMMSWKQKSLTKAGFERIYNCICVHDLLPDYFTENEDLGYAARDLLYFVYKGMIPHLFPNEGFEIARFDDDEGAAVSFWSLKNVDISLV